MANNNTQLNIHTTDGDIIATEDISGVKHELVKVEFGVDGVATKVSATNPLPVTDNAAEVSLASIDLKLTDNAQKTQIVDASGNQVTVTGNKLDVNAVFSGDIEIGAVELKNGTDDTRATVTPANALKVDGSAVTQPISGTVSAVVAGTVAVSNFPATQPVSGPLTQAQLESELDEKLGDLGQKNMAGSAPVVISSDQSSIPVSAASLPLPTGAATEATQLLVKADVDKIPSQGQALAAASMPVVLPAAQITALTPPAAITNYANETGGNLAAIKTDVDKIPSQGQAAMAASMPVVIASNQTAVPVSAASLPLPSGAATEATLQAIDAGIPAALGQTTMANSMPVVLASNQSAIPVTFSGSATDNTQLYSNNLSATGAITGIDTTGYASVVLQLSNVWSGSIVIEGCNDNSLFTELLVINCNELSMIDVINGNGNYTFKTTTKYIRLNVLSVTGTITALIVGRTVEGISGADLLSFAMDKNSNLPLYVSETNSKKDINNSLIPSDAPLPIYGFANASSGTNSILAIFDTTGYQSVAVQIFGTWSATVAVNGSNDGVNYVVVMGYPTSQSTAPLNTFSANGILIFPVTTKYIKVFITAYTSGTAQMVAYLRQQPVMGVINQNLAFINGTAPVSAGTPGVLAVGGNVSAGSAASSGSSPMVVAGVDTATSPIVRSIKTDPSGRLINTVDSLGISRVAGAIAPAGGIQNVVSVAVQDTTQFEGQSQIEILGQMLLEMRIMNQYLSELPLVLQGQNGKFDEPIQFRNDPTIFAN